MAEYEGKIRLVIKNYPYKYRDYSHIAAEASLAAGDQSKYWEMHDLLLVRSPKLDRNSLIQYGEELGLDMKRFVSDLDSMKHKELIEQDKELAFSLDLYNTPTYFINGRKVIGNRPYAYLKKIIEEELRRVEQ
jgi:protein-disulfide isomerase